MTLDDLRRLAEAVRAAAAATRAAIVAMAADGTHSLREIVDDRWTVSDKIDHLLSTLPIGGRVPFLSLFNDATSRSEVIVTFLAMLELMKLHFLEVEQAGTLGEIVVVRPEDKVNGMAAPLPSEMTSDPRAETGNSADEAPALALEA